MRLLDYRDAELDRANPYEATATLAHHVRDLRPDVVVTFGPDGAYGHPDHVAISQLASASVVAAASPHLSGQALPPHAASKLYYLAWPSAKWSAYEAAFRKLTVTVDQQERQATPWPDWAITTRVDTRAQWPTVWRAVQCHQSQIAAYERLQDLPQAHHEALWGQQSFYRAFSTVNGGRTAETDLFDGLRVTS